MEAVMTEGFSFNVNLLKYFWDNRERSFIPSLSGVMKQKYLFFYNIFAKLNDKKYTLDNLKAFKNGPVFYDIYTETKNGVLLEQTDVKNMPIDHEIANITMTLMYLYKSNISTITHALDIWKSAFGKESNDISEKFLTQKDKFMLKTLFKETKDVYNNYLIYYNKYDVPLLFKKEEKNKIINNFYDTLQSFTVENKCPTYVSLVNGEICFD